MNVAIIGAGAIVPDFLEAVSYINDIAVCAIYGREKSMDKLKSFRERYGIEKIYYDYDLLLDDEDIDVVYIALPNNLHYEYAKRALLKKKHVIVEKPFASNYSQAAELISIAEENKLIVFEAISNQYMPNYIKTKELIGELGDIKIVHLNFSQYSSKYDNFKKGIVHPVFDPNKDGGALMDLNVYNIHYVTGLFGRPMNIVYSANMDRGVDTSGILYMTYPSFQCVLIGAKDCKAPINISIQGNSGCLYSNEPANSYDSFEIMSNTKAGKKYELNDKMPRLYYELETFADIVNRKDYNMAASCNRHTLEVMEILEEARKQIKVNS